jgi:outer membrane murein-binding lipoprotein Lpp
MNPSKIWIGLLIIAICLIAGCSSPDQDKAIDQPSPSTSDVPSPEFVNF